MFSEKAKDIMDACRFCWMCRHTCPVAAVTGNEGNTPRARGLVLSMDSRGISYGAEAVDLVFQCTLCSACTNNCATGYDPTVYTREARSVAIAGGFLPSWMQKIVDQALEGTLRFVDEPESDEYTKMKRLIPNRGPVVLYRGGYTASAVPLMRVLEKAGVEYALLADELPTGSHLGDLVGYVEDVRLVAQDWIAQMQGAGAKTVIVLNPTDAAFLKQQLGEWGIDLPFSIETATSYVANLLAEGKLTTKAKDLEVVFHDPSRLTRILDDTTTARSILRYTGVDLKEAFLHGKLVTSAGTVLMKLLYPSIAELMVKNRWKELMRTGTSAVVTASPENYFMLSSAMPPSGKVIDIFSLLLD